MVVKYFVNGAQGLDLHPTRLCLVNMWGRNTNFSGFKPSYIFW